MGADAQRKEARKRKFGTPPSEPSPDTGTKADKNSSITKEPPKKKLKQAPLPLGSPDDSTTEYNETGGFIIDGDAAGQEQESTQKAQRFIVFIGLPRFYMLLFWVFKLMSMLYARKSTLHSYG